MLHAGEALLHLAALVSVIRRRCSADGVDEVTGHPAKLAELNADDVAVPDIDDRTIALADQEGADVPWVIGWNFRYGTAGV